MTDADEIAELMKGWSSGSFGTVEDSVAYHFDEHGSGQTLLEYLRQANAFPRQHAEIKVRSDGSLKFEHRDDRFLIVEADTQRILSYGRNNP